MTEISTKPEVVSFEQQQQLAFVHRALWRFAMGLGNDNAMLVASIAEFRNAIDPYIKLSEDDYCRAVGTGGVAMLHREMPYA